MPLPVLTPPTWNLPKIAPGQRVRVSQMIVGRDLCWITKAEGEVISAQPEPTGSWYWPRKERQAVAAPHPPPQG